MIFTFTPFKARRPKGSSSGSRAPGVEYLGLALLLMTVVHDVAPLQPTMALSKELSTVWTPSVFQQLVSFLALEDNAEAQGVDTLTEHIPLHTTRKESKRRQGANTHLSHTTKANTKKKGNTVFVRHLSLPASCEDTEARTTSGLSSPTAGRTPESSQDVTASESDAQSGTSSFSAQQQQQQQQQQSNEDINVVASFTKKDTSSASSTVAVVNVLDFTQQWFATTTTSATTSSPFVKSTETMLRLGLFPTVYTFRLSTESTVVSTAGATTMRDTTTTTTSSSLESNWKCASCGTVNSIVAAAAPRRRQAAAAAAASIVCSRCRRPYAQQATAMTTVAGGKEGSVELYFGNLPSSLVEVDKKQRLVQNLLNTAWDHNTYGPLHLQFHEDALSTSFSKTKNSSCKNLKNEASSVRVSVPAAHADRLIQLLHRNVQFFSETANDNDVAMNALFVYREQQKWLELFGAAAKKSSERNDESRWTICGRYALIVERVKERL